MKQEIQIFLLALTFFTRLPSPISLNPSDAQCHQALKYLPLIGWIVGSSAALVFMLSLLLFPLAIAIIFSMITTLILTGAFHEDGLADVCDGFGGGWTKTHILEIMKDSRVGTYGVIGLTVILMLKFHILMVLPLEMIPVVLVAGHSLSRLAATSLIFTHHYVRESNQSKAQLMVKNPSNSTGVIAIGLGLIPLFLLPSYYSFLVIIPIVLVTWWLARFFTQRIGGYTGDCLGAVQQVTEIVFYLIMETEFWIFI